MKGETKCMFLIIAPHNEGINLMYVLNHCTTKWRETKCMFLMHHTMKGESMFLIIAPHNVLNHCTTKWREKLNVCS